MSIPITLNQGISPSTPTYVNINSTQREDFPTSSSTEFRIKLNFPVLYARSVRLVSATIPWTIIVFNSSLTAPSSGRINNHIRFEDSTTLAVDCEITPGTYNINDLMTEMKTQMELVSPDTFTFSYDLTTLKLTITSSSANFRLLFAPILGVNDTLWFEIGFDNVDTALNATQTSVRNVLLTGPPNYFISLKEMHRVIYDTKSFSSNFIIPINVNNYGDVIHYTENSGYNSKYNIEVKNLQFLTVNLTSDFGPINNNNSDWGFVLAFE